MNKMDVCMSLHFVHSWSWECTSSSSLPRRFLGSSSYIVCVIIVFLFFLQEEPRKVCFNYDLFLNLEGNPPVNHLRCEKLTFNNPTKEFRRKLIKAGGVRSHDTATA